MVSSPARCLGRCLMLRLLVNVAMAALLLIIGPVAALLAVPAAIRGPDAYGKAFGFMLGALGGFPLVAWVERRP